VSELLKQWVLQCLLKKEKEMNKIAHVFLQSYFQVLKERMFSRSKVELG
jgi:hypothetical protein